jgi:hypothetical protein
MPIYSVGIPIRRYARFSNGNGADEFGDHRSQRASIEYAKQTHEYALVQRPLFGMTDRTDGAR